ncbi:Hypothetical protein SRAE_2000025200 [Strongyloides ratti]|uniref:Uncharacterized protein n=1 Tax=Strongyloides ratti TaxID=34506 RepID=A0A090LDH6_STRRB|nr:Hypothetical protein SRAE_2000025200 [Strongyloides ratti]CEF65575.1 Hypothetical protein SRAE_2000025200 [Strongyloides ratti]
MEEYVTTSKDKKEKKRKKEKKEKVKEIFSLSDSSDDESKIKEKSIREKNFSKVIETPDVKQDGFQIILRKHPERMLKAFDLIKKDLKFTSEIFSKENVKTKAFFEASPAIPTKERYEDTCESEDDYDAPPKKVKKVNLVVENISKPITHIKMLDGENNVILPDKNIEETCDTFVKHAKKIRIGHYLPQKENERKKKLKFLPDDDGIMRKGYPFYHWHRRNITDTYKARILQYNINIIYGPFTEEEDEIIIKNWKKFCKNHDTKEEELFWYLGTCALNRKSKTSRKEERDFIEETAMIPKICKGLNNRLSNMVICRLKKLYSPLNLLNNTKYICLFTRKEKDEIISLLKKYNHNIARVALETNKSWVSVQHLWTLEKMKTDYPFYAMAYIYNTIENSSLVKMKKLLTSDENFDDILKPILVNLTKEISDTTVESISFVINAMREYVKEEMKTTKKFKKSIKLLLPWRFFDATVKDTYLIYINMRITNIENGEGTNLKDNILYSEIEKNRFYINSPQYPKIAFDSAHKKYKKAAKIFGKGIIKHNCGERYQDLLIEKHIIENVLKDGEDLSLLLERIDQCKKVLLKYLYTLKKIDFVSYDFEPHEVNAIDK